VVVLSRLSNRPRIALRGDARLTGIERSEIPAFFTHVFGWGVALPHDPPAKKMV
jgi:hypothetical protein